jgi:hypothetical protein
MIPPWQLIAFVFLSISVVMNAFSVGIRSSQLQRSTLQPYSYSLPRHPSCFCSLRQPDQDFSEEETLLCVHLSLQPNCSQEQAVEAVAKYSQSFPFAVVLPVQPLMYLPTEDGVDIKFMRKKTTEKSSIDGGIRFFIKELEDGSGLEVTAKRNSIGQTINKMFAERLVVTAYISGISGKDDDRYGRSPVDQVRVESIYHKWM